MSEGAGGPLDRGVDRDASFSEFCPQGGALCRQFRVAAFGVDHEDDRLAAASLFQLFDRRRNRIETVECMECPSWNQALGDDHPHCRVLVNEVQDRSKVSRVYRSLEVIQGVPRNGTRNGHGLTEFFHGNN